MNSVNSMAVLTFDIIGPVTLLIVFGYILSKRQAINDNFIDTATRLVFNFGLPALLFINLSGANLHVLLNIKAISIGSLATLIIFFVSLVLINTFMQTRTNRGVMIQGIYRANMGIIGLAYCTKAYGSEGLAFASIYLGCITIIYNVLSVITLNQFKGSDTKFTDIFADIISNPIILSIIAGLLSAYFSISLPTVIHTSFAYLAQITLPLALICVGASLKFTSLSKYWKLTTIAVIGKCIIYPGLLVTMAIWTNIQGLTLGVLFFMAISPTAAASYIMVKKIGGNHELAAQIIAITTVASLPLTIIGFFVLGEFADIAI